MKSKANKKKTRKKFIFYVCEEQFRQLERRGITVSKGLNDTYSICNEERQVIFLNGRICTDKSFEIGYGDVIECAGIYFVFLCPGMHLTSPKCTGNGKTSVFDEGYRMFIESIIPPQRVLEELGFVCYYEVSVSITDEGQSSSYKVEAIRKKEKNSFKKAEISWGTGKNSPSVSVYATLGMAVGFILEMTSCGSHSSSLLSDLLKNLKEDGNLDKNIRNHCMALKNQDLEALGKSIYRELTDLLGDNQKDESDGTFSEYIETYTRIDGDFSLLGQDQNTFGVPREIYSVYMVGNIPFLENIELHNSPLSDIELPDSVGDQGEGQPPSPLPPLLQESTQAIYDNPSPPIIFPSINPLERQNNGIHDQSAARRTSSAAQQPAQSQSPSNGLQGQEQELELELELEQEQELEQDQGLEQPQAPHESPVISLIHQGELNQNTGTNSSPHFSVNADPPQYGNSIIESQFQTDQLQPRGGIAYNSLNWAVILQPQQEQEIELSLLFSDPTPQQSVSCPYFVLSSEGSIQDSQNGFHSPQLNQYNSGNYSFHQTAPSMFGDSINDSMSQYESPDYSLRPQSHPPSCAPPPPVYSGPSISPPPSHPPRTNIIQMNGNSFNSLSNDRNMYNSSLPQSTSSHANTQLYSVGVNAQAGNPMVNSQSPAPPDQQSFPQGPSGGAHKRNRSNGQSLTSSSGIHSSSPPPPKKNGPQNPEQDEY